METMGIWSGWRRKRKWHGILQAQIQTTGVCVHVLVQEWLCILSDPTDNFNAKSIILCSWKCMEHNRSYNFLFTYRCLFYCCYSAIPQGVSHVSGCTRVDSKQCCVHAKHPGYSAPISIHNIWVQCTNQTRRTGSWSGITNQHCDHSLCTYDHQTVHSIYTYIC